jgi:hypothetical protein
MFNRQKFVRLPSTFPASMKASSSHGQCPPRRSSIMRPLKTIPRPRPSRDERIFTIPPPLKRLFDTFPLVTYPANELPLRAPQNRHQHALYVFTTADGAVSGAPSYNPSCLKWQVSTGRGAFPEMLLYINHEAKTICSIDISKILQGRLPRRFFK